jgi:IS1 family transposase
MVSVKQLATEQRAHVLQLLCEGMSIRAVARVTGFSKNTVAKLLNDAGGALGAYQDQVFRELSCKRAHVDENWSFTYAKAKNVNAKAAPEGADDTWTWTAIDADTMLVFAVLVGGRDSDYAREFLNDIRQRVAGRFQLTSDGFTGYGRAARRAFAGEMADQVEVVKVYGPAPEGARRYSPPKLVSTHSEIVMGDPDGAHISTSFVERQNLTMRMHMRRFTRLTNGFSKKVEAHVNALALHFAYYNFVRLHRTLKVTPAMAAGVTDRLWEMSDLVEIVKAAEGLPKKRGPYKVKSKAVA